MGTGPHVYIRQFSQWLLRHKDWTWREKRLPGEDSIPRRRNVSRSEGGPTSLTFVTITAVYDHRRQRTAQRISPSRTEPLRRRASSMASRITTDYRSARRSDRRGVVQRFTKGPHGIHGQLSDRNRVGRLHTAKDSPCPPFSASHNEQPYGGTPTFEPCGRHTTFKSRKDSTHIQ
jgi:hypothetical protein